MEAHLIELREQQNLNQAQADRIRALTVAADAQGATCEDSEALLQENADLRQENDEL